MYSIIVLDPAPEIASKHRPGDTALRRQVASPADAEAHEETGPATTTWSDTAPAATGPRDGVFPGQNRRRRQLAPHAWTADTARTVTSETV